MTERPRFFEPVSVGFAVLGSGLTGVGIAVVAVRALFAGMRAGHPSMFGAGIAAMLFGYGLLVLFGAWLGYRRHPLAQGLIVAPALLHVAMAVSAFKGANTTEIILASLALVVFVGTIVAAILPATRQAWTRRAD